MSLRPFVGEMRWSRSKTPASSSARTISSRRVPDQPPSSLFSSSDARGAVVAAVVVDLRSRARRGACIGARGRRGDPHVAGAELLRVSWSARHRSGARLAKLLGACCARRVGLLPAASASIRASLSFHCSLRPCFSTVRTLTPNSVCDGPVAALRVGERGVERNACSQSIEGRPRSDPAGSVQRPSR